MKRIVSEIGAVLAMLALVLSPWGGRSASPLARPDDRRMDAAGYAACVPLHHFSTVAKGVLSISMAPSLPYVGYDESTHKLQGIDGEIVAAIARLECLGTAVQVLTGGSALQAVLSGRADFTTGGWYKTAERAKVVGQTVPMYYDFSAIISKQGFTRASQLKGMTVGCVQGSLFVDPLEKLLGTGNVRLYQLSDAVFQDLAVGRIQAAILGSGEGGYLLKQRGGGFKLERALPERVFPPSLTAGNVNLPHTKGNVTLGRALDADITVLRQNGTVRRVLKKWGLTNPSNFELK